MSAPKVLGVEMLESGSHSWRLDFGPMTVRLLATGYVGSFDAICACRVLLRAAQQVDCIAAIERELLAIRNAIPEGKP